MCVCVYAYLVGNFEGLDSTAVEYLDGVGMAGVDVESVLDLAEVSLSERLPQLVLPQHSHSFTSSSFLHHIPYYFLTLLFFFFSSCVLYHNR